MITMKKYLLLCLSVLLITIVCPKPASAESTSDLTNLIETLEVGEPIYYENLTIIPVYNPQINDRTHYTTLDEALNKNWLEITEIDGGNVPKVRLTNRSNSYIYLMGGEILSGGKQDRIIGRDVLIAPKSRNVVVPVYCTEQGRWQQESATFYSKSNLGTFNMRATAQYAPSNAQYEIWNTISDSNQKMGVNSQTQAYQRLYEDKSVRRKISQHEGHMNNIPQLNRDTVGVVVGIGGDIISVDLFANPDLFRKLWPKILKSSALSAISTDAYGSIDEQDAIQILRRIHDAGYSQNTAIDLGTELSAYNNQVNVNALVHRRSVLHIAAFPTENRSHDFNRNTNLNRRIPVMRR